MDRFSAMEIDDSGVVWLAGKDHYYGTELFAWYDDSTGTSGGDFWPRHTQVDWAPQNTFALRDIAVAPSGKLLFCGDQTSLRN